MMGIIRRLILPRQKRQLTPSPEERRAAESPSNLELWPVERISNALKEPPSPQAINASLILEPQLAPVYALDARRRNH